MWKFFLYYLFRIEIETAILKTIIKIKLKQNRAIFSSFFFRSNFPSNKKN